MVRRLSLTWTIADRSIKGCSDNANVKWLIRGRQALDMLEVCEGRYSRKCPLLPVSKWAFFNNIRCDPSQIR